MKKYDIEWINYLLCIIIIALSLIFIIKCSQDKQINDGSKQKIDSIQKLQDSFIIKERMFNKGTWSDNPKNLYKSDKPME